MDAKIFQNHLEKDLIPFWNKMEDKGKGGFYGFADCNGMPDKTYVKSCILNSRILWFYSASYKLLHREELLEKANHAFDFLKEYFFDSRYGGVLWSVKADGTPQDTTKHTYNMAFAIYALSVFYQAGKNKEALNLAYEIYRIIEDKCRDNDGYFEAFSREFEPVSNEKLSENGVMAARTMNTLLHVMEAYTELFRADEFFMVADSIRKILQIFKTKVFDSEKEMCRVFFDKTYNSLIDLDSYGHDIEASWLIDRACQVLGDKAYCKEMLPVINALADGACKNGLDKNKCSMNNENERGRINASKIWWVQAESVIGFYNAYQNNPDKKEYKFASENIWDYIQKHIIDKKTGEWIECISQNNSLKKISLLPIHGNALTIMEECA